MSEDRDSIQPDLIERVDSLLEQIEETSKSYIPKEERGLGSDALISDDGAIAQPKPEDSTEPSTTDPDEATESDEVETEAPPTDSIETAQQALEAIEEIEQQAEDLVGESIDGLLESTETAAEISAEPEAEPETAPIDEINGIDTTLIDELDMDIAEIESALESSTIPESARAEFSDDESAAPAEPASTGALESAAQTDEDDELVDAIDALLDAEPIENLAEPIESVEEIDEVDGVDELVDSIEESLQSLPETEPEPAAESEPETELETAHDEPSDSAPDTTPEADIQEQEEPRAEADVDEISLDEIEASLTVEHDSPSSGSLDDSMDLLDSALAMAADDMLDGDFETEEGELVSGEAVASAMETALRESEDSTTQKPAAADSEDDSAEDSIDDSIEDAVGDLLDSADAPVAADEESEAPQDADAALEDTNQDAAEAEEQAATNAEPVAETAPESVAQQAADAESETTDEANSEAQSESKADAETEPQAAEPDSDVLEEIEALEQIEAAQPISVPAWFERSIEVVRPWVDKYDPLKGKTMDAVASVLGTILVLIITHATPIGARAVLIVSKPLSKQSPEIRNAVGYIALWTGFLAMVVWVYLLMFRAPHIPQPDTAPSRVIDVTEPMDPDPDPASVLPES